MTTLKIGLALGAGAARGFSHIPMLEALDECGVKPTRIAGASIGALLGAAYASGMTGAEIREFVLHATKDVGTMMERFWDSSRPHSIKELFDRGLSIQLEAVDVVNAFLPKSMAKNFDDLQIPFVAVATDFFGWKQKVFSQGDIAQAVAASIAIPNFFQPVMIDGRAYLDGFMTNPVPISEVVDGTDHLIAIDVNGGPNPTDVGKTPSMLDVAVASSQIIQNTVSEHAVKLYNPDIVIKPNLQFFEAHEFYKAEQILAAGDLAKDGFKRQLERLLS